MDQIILIALGAFAAVVILANYPKDWRNNILDAFRFIPGDHWSNKQTVLPDEPMKTPMPPVNSTKP